MPTLTLHLDDVKEEYIKREKYVEDYFLKHSLKRNIVELEDGAVIKVLISLAKLSNFKKRTDKNNVKVALCIPDLWFTDVPPSKEYFREMRLSPLIIRGNADIAVLLKAEGMNELAYTNEDGTGVCQEKTAAAAVEILAKYLNEFKSINTSFEFCIVSYSEGATQGASIVKKIIEKKLGKINEFTSICGGGLIGPQDQNKAKPIPFVKKAIRCALSNPNPQCDNCIYFIPATEIEKAEHEIGSIKEEPLYKGLGSEFDWAKRYIRTRLKVSEINPIPFSRLKATCCTNNDYKFLAKLGVPLIFFLQTKDVFFSFYDTSATILKLKKEFRNSKILFMVSNNTHDKVWSQPTGIAYFIDQVKQKEDII